MFKKIFYAVIILMIICYIGLTFFMKIVHGKNDVDYKRLDVFLEQIKDDYHYIKDTRLYTYQGDLVIELSYPGHKDLVIDKTLYDEIHNFLSQEEVMKEIAERDQSVPVYIRISFNDTVNVSSHEIRVTIEKSNGDAVYHYKILGK